MLDRIVITFVIIGGLGLLWLGWHYYKSRLVQALPVIGAFRGKTTLLYFTAEYCAICKHQQAPIIQKLADDVSDTITIETIDVMAQPELAGQFKVLTLPTTVVLNAQGRVVNVNYGLTHQRKLEKQLFTVTNNPENQGIINELSHAA